MGGMRKSAGRQGSRYQPRLELLENRLVFSVTAASSVLQPPEIIAETENVPADPVDFQTESVLFCSHPYTLQQGEFEELEIIEELPGDDWLEEPGEFVDESEFPVEFIDEHELPPAGGDEEGVIFIAFADSAVENPPTTAPAASASPTPISLSGVDPSQVSVLVSALGSPAIELSAVEPAETAAQPASPVRAPTLADASGETDMPLIVSPFTTSAEPSEEAAAADVLSDSELPLFASAPAL